MPECAPGQSLPKHVVRICCGRDAAARLSQLALEKRVLAATADGKRGSAGQRERIDVAVDAPRLLGVPEPQ